MSLKDQSEQLYDLVEVISNQSDAYQKSLNDQSDNIENALNKAGDAKQSLESITESIIQSASLVDKKSVQAVKSIASEVEKFLNMTDKVTNLHSYFLVIFQ